jgi:O-antigen ligase
LTAEYSSAAIRNDASELFRSAARVCFGAALVLMSFRFRIVLVHRSQQAIPADYTDFLLFAADVAILLVLALWLISLAAAPRRLNLGPRAIWIPLAGLTFAGWLSAFSSEDAPLSVYHAIRLLTLFWFYLYIVNEIRSVRWVLIPIAIQVLIQSLVALGQFAVQHSLSLQSVGELYLDPAERGISIVAAGGLRLLRPYGLTDHPNILGGCLAFGLILILAAYLEGVSRWIVFPVLIIGLAALLVTFSRSAWLAFLVGAAVLICLQLFSRRRALFRHLIWFGIAGLLVCMPITLLYPGAFGVRLNAGGSFSTPSVEQQSIGERLLLVKYFSSIVVSHPVLGVGLGAAPLALKQYQPTWSVGFEPPHIALLEAAAETGLPGAAFYLALLIAPFALFIKHRAVLLGDPRSQVAIGLILAITVIGFFDYYTWLLVAGRAWLWLAWGLCAVALTPDPRLVASTSSSSTNSVSMITNVNPTT